MARHTLTQQLLQLGLTLVRDIGLTEGLRRSTQRLPRGARLWLRDRRMNARIRAGDAASLVSELRMPVAETELTRCYEQAWALLAEREPGADLGDYLEFGVHVGGSLGCMHHAVERRGLDGVRLFGFDSFEGLPRDTDSDDTSPIASWRPGDLKAPLEVCEAYLNQKGVRWDRTTLVKGFFDDTLTDEAIEQHRIRRAGVIMVDCDLYSSTKTVLDFCEPLIGDHAVILFDDWWPGTLGAARTGERRAFEEFLAAHPELVAEELESYRPKSAKVFLVSRRG